MLKQTVLDGSVCFIFGLVCVKVETLLLEYFTWQMSAALVVISED